MEITATVDVGVNLDPSNHNSVKTVNLFFQLPVIDQEPVVSSQMESPLESVIVCLQSRLRMLNRNFFFGHIILNLKIIISCIHITCYIGVLTQGLPKRYNALIAHLKTLCYGQNLPVSSDLLSRETISLSCDDPYELSA